IVIHGTFIIGLPGETADTIQETIRFAKDVNPRTIQVSLPAPYPGTELFAQAKAKGWFEGGDLVRDDGVQIPAMSYPRLSASQMEAAVAAFYKTFYFRPSKIAEITFEMAQSWSMTKRRLREGVEFFNYLRSRGAEAQAA